MNSRTRPMLFIRNATCLAVVLAAITVSAAELAVTFPAGRYVFLAGEQIDVRVTSKEPFSGKISFRYSHAGTQVTVDSALVKTDPGGVIVLRVDSSYLAPGETDITVTIGESASKPIRIGIAPRVQTSAFTIIDFEDSFPHRPLAFLDGLEVAAVNLLILGTGRVGSADSLIAPLSGGRNFFEEAMMRGISIMLLGHDTPGRPILHSSVIDEAETSRHMAILAQQARRYPNFIGMVYADAPTVGSIGEAWWLDERGRSRRRDMQRDFAQRYTPGGNAVTREIGWSMYVSGRIAAQFETWQTDLKSIDPRMIGTAIGQPTLGIELGHDPTVFFKYLDVALAAIHSEDGVQPVHASWYADLLRAATAGKKPVWLLARNIDARWKYTQMAMEALSRKATGFGVYGGWMHHRYGEGGIQPRILGGAVDPKPAQLRLAHEILQKYGGLIMRSTPERQVALLYSYTDDVINGDGYLRTFAAYRALLRAGFPAAIVTEQTIGNGGLDGVKVLLLADTTLIPDATRATLALFIKNGGRVLAGKDADLEQLGVNGILKLPIPFKPIDKWDGTAEHVAGRARAQANAKVLRQFMQLLTKPFALSNNPNVVASTFFAGDCRYIVAFNDSVPPFPEAFGQWYEQAWIYPARASIALAGNGYDVYDVLTGGLVPIRTENGKQFIDVDFINFPGGRIFACVPGGVGLVTVGLPASVTAGESLAVGARVSNRRGKSINGLVPVEIHIIDPDGDSVYHLFRVVGPKQDRINVPLGRTARTGSWTVTVRELVSGRSARGVFTVKPHLKSRWAIEAPNVRVYNTKAIRAHLKERTFSIVSGTAPKAAADLEAALKRVGVRSSTKTIDTAAASPYPLKWVPDSKDMAQWRKIAEGKIVAERAKVREPNVKHPYRWTAPGLMIGENLIIQGIAGKDPLLAMIGRLLPEPLSTATPGHGVVALVRSPFFAGRHVIAVVGSDARGLESAAATLAAAAKGREEDTPPARTTLTVPATVSGGNTPAFKWRRGKGKQWTHGILAGRGGDRVLDLKFSDDGKSIVISTNGLGNNVFMLTRDGELKWKNKAGIADARIQILDNGTYVLAHAGAGNRPEWSLFGKTGDLQSVANYEKDYASVIARIKGKQRISPGIKRKDGKIIRIDAFGRILWQYDDIQNIRTRDDRTKAREIHGFAVSPGKRFVAVSYAAPNEGGRPGVPGRWGLYLIDAVRGWVMWQREGLAARELLCTDDGTMIADKNIYDWTGKQTGSFSFDGRVKTVYPMAGDTLIVSFQDRNVLTVQKLGASDFINIPIHSQVAAAAVTSDRKQLAVITQKGALSLIDNTGKMLWKNELGTAAFLTFSPDDTILLVGSGSGELFGYDMAGKLKWKQSLAGLAYMAPEDARKVIAAQDAVPREQAQAGGPVGRQGTRVSGLRTLPYGVRIGANILSNGNFDDGLAGWDAVAGKAVRRGGLGNSPAVRLTGELRRPIPVSLEKGKTYVVEMWYRPKEQAGTIEARFVDAAGKTRGIPHRDSTTTEGWYCLSWALKGQGDDPGDITLVIRNADKAHSIVVDDVWLVNITYPTRNYAAGDGIKAASVHLPTVKFWWNHVRIDPKQIFDGKVDVMAPTKQYKNPDPALPYQWGNLHKLGPGHGHVDIVFSQPREIGMIAIYENPNMLSTWGMIESKAEAGDDKEKGFGPRGAVASGGRRNSPGVVDDWGAQVLTGFNSEGRHFHVHRFPPITTQKLRIYLAGNAAATEIEVYGTGEDED